MRGRGYLLSAAIVAAPLMLSPPVLAQQHTPSGQPSGAHPRGGGFQVQAVCPEGSRWVDAPGYVKSEWREGHCEALTK